MKNKIKVLVFVGRMQGGGVESFVMSYFRKLYDRVDFTFMCFDDSTLIPYEEFERLGAKVVLVPHPKKFFKFNKVMDKYLKENHFDIIHSHVNTLSVFPLRIAKKNNIKIRIAHSHSSSSKKEFLRHIAKSILRLFSRRYSNVYFTCSESAGRFQFGNKAYDQGKVILIKNAIDVEKFLFDENKRKIARDSLDIKDDEYVVGTVGRLVSAKNHKFLISLAKIAPNCQFLIIGTGSMKEELEAEIAQKDVKNIRLIEPSLDIEYYYSCFDIFAMPSLYEGFGLAAIEAEANGLYVLVSTNVPSETLMTKYGQYLPIEENDLEKWKNEIENRPGREAHIDKIIDSGYDIESASNFLLKKYEELLEK